MKTNKIFFINNKSERGGMLMELLLTLALVSVILPFVVKNAHTRIESAENIKTTREIDSVKTALEKYIEANKKELLAPVGRNITRAKIADLEKYGLPEYIIDKKSDEFQLRIVKTPDVSGRASLHGVVLLSNSEITPLRTREIVNMGGDEMGFLENRDAVGAFGTWHDDASSIGLAGGKGIIETTSTSHGGDLYLQRTPSENESDATMLSALNLGGHNILNAKFADGASARFEESLKSDVIAMDKIIFQNRIALDKKFNSNDVSVSGTLSSDSKNMNILGTLSLSGVAKLSNLMSENLWVNNLNLEGLSFSGAGVSILRINQTLDITSGNITSEFVSVGFTGSITPKLIIKNRIEDAENPAYFWDAATRTANFMDVSFPGLNRIAAAVTTNEKGSDTFSGQSFGSVSANKNATAGDFINSINEISIRVNEKYYQLNLE